MSFKDAMFSKSLGFELQDDPDEPRRIALKDTRQLFFLFALIFGLLCPFVSLIRGGAFERYHVRPKKPDLALRAEAKWDAKLVGSLSPAEVLYPTRVWPEAPKTPVKPGEEAPKAPEPEWYGFDSVLTRVKPGYVPPKPKKDPAGAPNGQEPEEKAGEDASAPAEARADANGSWVEDRVPGWLPASLVDAGPGGLKGAWASRSGTLTTFWGIAGFCLLVATVMPGAMVWFYKLWMTVLVGWVGHFMTKVTMTLFFFTAVVFMSTAYKILGKDPLDRKIPEGDDTLWKDKSELPQYHFERSF